ncbi:MAG: DUF4253 domain-containing protein [Peptococcaceae bacterium]|nr:DUF4253 domain-containing protein [Peptococcaceae bacterium]
MKTMLVGLLSAVLALVCYNIYDFINNRWFKRKDFMKTVADVNFSEEVGSFLWKISGGKVRQLLTYNKKGEEISGAGLEALGIKDTVLGQIKEGLPADYLAFITEFDKKKQHVGIIKSADKFAIVKTMQTQSPKNNMSNSKLISELRTLDKKYPFKISGAGQDWVELFFENLPEDTGGIVDTAKQLCPLSETSETMDEDLKTNRKLFLWWQEDREETSNLSRTEKK